jgi:hypothetical protein
MDRYPDVAVLDLKRTCTIDDVCDFVVQYIESDILGLLADRHLTIAGTEIFPKILSTVSKSLLCRPISGQYTNVGA